MPFDLYNQYLDKHNLVQEQKFQNEALEFRTILLYLIHQSSLLVYKSSLFPLILYYIIFRIYFIIFWLNGNVIYSKFFLQNRFNTFQHNVEGFQINVFLEI